MRETNLGAILTGQAVPEQQEMILWHPDMHRQAAHEQLAFLTIGFAPRYDRPTAQAVIDAAAEEVGIRSLVVWELQRKPDVLVRAWMPPTANLDDFQGELARAAEARGLTLAFVGNAVQSTLHHHLWPQRLDPTDVEVGLEAGGDLLVSGNIYGGVPEAASILERRRIVSPVSLDNTGIKFFIWIQLSSLLPNEGARNHLETELINRLTSTPHLYATSIYRTLGPASYLVTGRFKPDYYEVLARELQPGLAGLGHPFIATNTDTALSTLFGPIHRTEALLPSESATTNATSPKHSIDEILLAGESDTVEMKGSAFTPIPSDDRPVSPEAMTGIAGKVRDSITKTCVGFLNSSGGTLVIGLLEKDRIRLQAAQKYNPDATEFGDFIVVGHDTKVDKKSLNWDEFERRLREFLNSRISPSADPWIDIVPHQIGDLKVAVVTVKEPNSWFWAKTDGENEVFYVRYGNATRPLRGPAQIQHIESRKRSAL